MFSPSQGSEVSKPGRYQPGGEIKNDGSYLAGREKGLLGVNMAGCRRERLEDRASAPEGSPFPQILGFCISEPAFSGCSFFQLHGGLDMGLRTFLCLHFSTLTSQTRISLHLLLLSHPTQPKGSQ